jgi:hypothetical protein
MTMTISKATTIVIATIMIAVKSRAILNTMIGIDVNHDDDHDLDDCDYLNYDHDHGDDDRDDSDDDHDFSDDYSDYNGDDHEDYDYGKKLPIPGLSTSLKGYLNTPSRGRATKSSY